MDELEKIKLEVEEERLQIYLEKYGKIADSPIKKLDDFN